MSQESVSSFFANAARPRFDNCSFIATSEPHCVTCSRPPSTNTNSAVMPIPTLPLPIYNERKPPESTAQVYARTLLLAKRGYPLWKPRAQGAHLPEAYKREGARIGDVGILNEFGGFTYLFNVFHSADHAINAGRVPPNFRPLPKDIYYHHIEEVPEEFEPGSHVASEASEISKNHIPFHLGQTQVPGVPEEIGAGLSYISSATQGALLILPEGGKRIDHMQSSALYQYTVECAQSWYDFVNGDPPDGLAMGLKEGLYFVTGCDKARAWGVASFNNASPQQRPVRLDFVPKPAGHIGGPPKYRFGRCEYAATSSDADISGVPSGSVFLRGLRIAIRNRTRNPFMISTEVTDIRHIDIETFTQKTDSINIPSLDSVQGFSSVDCCLETSYPVRYQVNHPSDTINRWILDNHEEVDVAITHDDDWASVIHRDEKKMPSDSKLIRDLSKRLKIVNCEHCTYACFHENIASGQNSNRHDRVQPELKSEERQAKSNTFHRAIVENDEEKRKANFVSSLKETESAAYDKGRKDSEPAIPGPIFF